ncbi:MAG: PEGA domain-containing protein [Deltaproteobacteria bacterium]|nr:PEGA domain-containing protein [Deltaproteobacteria bacterium]
MRCLLVLTLLAMAALPARADSGEVGVVVVTSTNGSALQTDVTAHLEAWMKKHDHTVVAGALSRDAVNTIANCFLIDDLKCARGVVEARSKASSVVFTRIEAAGKDLTFTTYWFVKGKEVISERRVCETCTTEDWRGLLDGMVGRLLASDVETGKLHLESQPSGLLVLVDNVQVGATPFDQELPVGKHTISLSHAGVIVANKDIEIHANKLKRLTIETEVETKAHSKIGPGILLGSGIALIGGGGIALYLGEQKTDKIIHPEYVPIGIGIMAAGAGATIVGAILLSQTGHTSAPVAAITRDSAYFGWVTRF